MEFFTGLNKKSPLTFRRETFISIGKQNRTLKKFCFKMDQFYDIIREIFQVKVQF